jgi:hypothetical protein
MNNCDCSARCGDDPWLKDGRATPCAYFRELVAERARRAAFNAAVDELVAARKAGDNEAMLGAIDAIEKYRGQCE